MRGVTITAGDSQGFLAFDLRDILQVLTSARDSSWEVRDVEATGRGAPALHAASDRRARISGNELIGLAAEIDQTIEGRFAAYLHDAPERWGVVRAVDSSAFDIYSDAAAVLSAIRLRFRDVVEIDTAH